ncbi:MAG: putative ABC exporter domain-containing protein [Clostridiales bacterium]|nr:putative ABC exporter domain-containing protein [Clostridiales bacterium]
MKLFWYYTWHSFVNTIKKVMKTWVAVMLACLLIGLLIGFGISLISPKDKDEDKKEDTESSIVMNEDGEEVTEEDDSKEMSFLEERGKTKADLVDLIVSGVVLLALAYNVATADKSGKIFKPADVPMLFASPMKPQSVLMFRLIGTLAASLMLSLYMLFQLPNLIYNAKLGMWGAISLIVVYALGLIFGTLVQVALYTILSRTKRGTKDLKNYIIAFYAVLLGAFFIYKMASGKEMLTAAFDFFAGKNTFWVPFWGWLRGISYYAITGNTALSLMYLALFIFACALVVVLIWKVKADFYEDALVEADKMAVMLEGVQNASKGGVMKRQKDRSDKLDRDGFKRGFGANVFFHKAIFNRLRFSKFKVINKTVVIFTIAAAASAWIVGNNAKIGDVDPFLVPACTLTFLMFYRTLGNPLLEDTKREFFVLIPESPLSKIWYSLLGSVAVNAIDLVIPVIVAAIMLGTNPLTVIGWYLFILSVSVFGTTVGTFVDVSVPGDQANTIKTFVQIMILYFGLLPAAVFVVLGVYFNLPLIPMLLGSCFNVGMGALFTLMTPHFLVNR